MSVFVPLTETSQKLVKENMLATKNLYHPLKGLSFTIEKDFVLGIYVMTRDDAKDPNNVEKLADNTDIIDKLFTTEDFSQMIQYKGRTNTLGRRVLELLFNDFIKINEAIDQKKLASYLEDLVKIKPEILEEVMYRIIRVSATVSTIFGGTMSTKDFTMPEDLNTRTKQVVNNPDKYDVDTELDSITKEFIKRNNKSGQLPSLLVTSGARGSASNIKQISVAKGYVSDTSGKVIPEPIKSNFVEGFKPIDYFISAYGSRKGVVDRVLNTAKSGYLQRQMVYLAASVKSGDTKDCGTDKFFDVLLTEEYADVLKNRVLRNGDILTKDYIEKNNLIGKVVQLYSPMFCKSRHICRKCFPDTYRKSIDNVKNIGIVSGNIVGERASQLQMRGFHLGGAAKILYVTQEIPQLDGIIRQDNMTLITNKKIRIRVIDYTSETTEEYQSNEFGVTVIEDDKAFDEIMCNFPAIIKFNALMAQNIKESETDVYLEYEPEDTIGEIIATATDTASAVVMLQSIMNHSNRFESGKDLVIELYETFRVSTKIPLIFLEILVSQLMRDPEKEYYPYRLGSMKEAPKFLGIKTVAAVENPIRGAIFERILDVITNSVIQSNVKDEHLSSDLEELFHI